MMGYTMCRKVLHMSIRNVYVFFMSYLRLKFVLFLPLRPFCKQHMSQQRTTYLGPISPIGFHNPLCYTGFSFLTTI